MEMRKTAGRCAVSMSAAAALLAACGGSQPPIVPGAMPQSRAAAEPADRGRSWMLPEAKSKDLLYVVYPTQASEGYIDAYSYPQGVLEGQITGLSNPGGDCTDASGDVYVTNGDPSGHSIVEFAHGGTKPIRTLLEPGTNPFSCAVDPANGDLAVTNYGTSAGQGASIAVYRKAKGKPRIYTDSNFLNYAYCTYDNADDLFVDGKYPGGYETPIVAELPHGGKSLLTLNLNDEIGWLSGVQWDKKYLAVGQAIKPYILRFRISGTTGTLVGSTPLTDATDAFQFVFARNKVIVANVWFYDRYEFETDVLVYNYPRGGNSTQRIAYKIGGSELDSVALSPKPQNGLR